MFCYIFCVSEIYIPRIEVIQKSAMYTSSFSYPARKIYVLKGSICKNNNVKCNSKYIGTLMDDDNVQKDEMLTKEGSTITDNSDSKNSQSVVTKDQDGSKNVLSEFKVIYMYILSVNVIFCFLFQFNTFVIYLFLMLIFFVFVAVMNKR